jgi:hypothetical protein
MLRNPFTIENAVSNWIWWLISFWVFAGLSALTPVILHGTELSWPWLVLLGFGSFCLLSAGTLAWCARLARAPAATPPVVSTPPAATALPPLAEPDLASEAISQLEAIRPGLAAGTLAQDSSDVGERARERS